MQTEIILAKYGELALKGLNRNTFEDILMKNIKRRLKPIGSFSYTRAQSTIYIVPESSEMDLDSAMETLKKIFGIAALCKACVCEKNLEDISRVGILYFCFFLFPIWRRLCWEQEHLKWKQSVQINNFHSSHRIFAEN